ncbi:MAG: enoyl-CoA hydratase [Hyphomicrobiales bacterium]
MGELIYEVRDAIGFVTLNRPEVRNALTFGMYHKLAKICRETTLGGDVKCIIVSGAGDKAFAAGTDVSQFRKFNSSEDALDYERTIDGVMRDIEMCPVPTIAAITGACTGGGAAIAAACDIRICDEKLKFGFPIARTLGNCLSINNLNRMTSLLGAGRVRELILTARRIDAVEAKSCGLVTDVLNDCATVHGRAVELAGLMAGHAPITMRSTKEALRRLRLNGPSAEGSDLILDAYMSKDFKEGLEAFLGKRRPVWKGE